MVNARGAGWQLLTGRSQLWSVTNVYHTIQTDQFYERRSKEDQILTAWTCKIFVGNGIVLANPNLPKSLTSVCWILAMPRCRWVLSTEHGPSMPGAILLDFPPHSRDCGSSIIQPMSTTWNLCTDISESKITLDSPLWTDSFLPTLKGSTDLSGEWSLWSSWPFVFSDQDTAPEIVMSHVELAEHDVFLWPTV